MKRVIRILPLVMLIALVWPAALRATERELNSSQVQNRLATFELKAGQANRMAHELESLTRSEVSWESHAHYLNSLRHSVNEMGRLLLQLETAKPAASDLQAKTMEHARPHLEEFAARLEGAITSLNSDHRIISHMDYRDGLRQIASNANLLSQKVDALLDYHQASQRLGELEVVIN